MKEKFGDCLVDIGKYVITALVITPLFGRMDDAVWLYWLGSASSLVLIFIGLRVQKKSTVKKKRRN